MYFLGLDVGSSSVKAALVESESGKSVLSVHEPKNEMSISSIKNDWAEQDPNLWWEYTCLSIKRVCKESNVCLLYTSPSPRDATLSRMPSSA